MAISLCLQDWTTVQGNNDTVVQTVSAWAELAAFQDAAVYLEVAQVTGTSSTAILNLDLQSSPTKDEAFFGAAPGGGSPWIASYSFGLTPAVGVQPLQFSRWASTGLLQPLARYLRWRARFAVAAQSITFRIWLNLNQAGGS